MSKRGYARVGPGLNVDAPFAIGLAALQRAVTTNNSETVFLNARAPGGMFLDDAGTSDVTRAGQEVRSVLNGVNSQILAVSKGTDAASWDGDGLLLPQDAWLDVAMPFEGGSRSFVASFELLGGESSKTIFEAYTDGTGSPYAAGGLAVTTSGAFESYVGNAIQIEAGTAVVGEKYVVAFAYNSATGQVDMNVNGVSVYSGVPTGFFNTPSVFGLRIGANRTEARRSSLKLFDFGFVNEFRDLSETTAEYIRRQPS